MTPAFPEGMCGEHGDRGFALCGRLVIVINRPQVEKEARNETARLFETTREAAGTTKVDLHRLYGTFHITSNKFHISRKCDAAYCGCGACHGL
jgi:hypothetical protein